MKLQDPKRLNYIEQIAGRIEAAFPNSIVVWAGSGTPDEDFANTDTEVMEAYGIPEGQYERFEETVWSLQKTVADPNGFSIMVFEFSPSEVSQFRQAEYDAEVNRRRSTTNRKAKSPKSPSLKDSETMA
jgi:hypothetical protein